MLRHIQVYNITLGLHRTILSIQL